MICTVIHQWWSTYQVTSFCVIWSANYSQSYINLPGYMTIQGAFRKTLSIQHQPLPSGMSLISPTCFSLSQHIFSVYKQYLAIKVNATNIIHGHVIHDLPFCNCPDTSMLMGISWTEDFPSRILCWVHAVSGKEGLQYLLAAVLWELACEVPWMCRCISWHSWQYWAHRGPEHHSRQSSCNQEGCTYQKACLSLSYSPNNQCRNCGISCATCGGPKRRHSKQRMPMARLLLHW